MASMDARPVAAAGVLGLVVRPNTGLVRREVYEAKAARWARTWPGLTGLPWPGNRERTATAP